jgi:Domain of unknown function (DUF1844)
MDEDKEITFKVTDRRKFNIDGTPRDADTEVATTEAAQPPPTEQPAAVEGSDVEAGPGDEAGSSNVFSFESAKKKERPEAAEPPEPAAAAASQPAGAAADRSAETSAAERAYNQARGPETGSMPEASFLGLVNMLAVEAAMSLGMIRTQEGTPPVDLEAGRHLIDLLGVVEQKTRGNLTPEEASMLENVLADLRMQFVALSRRR